VHRIALFLRRFGFEVILVLLAVEGVFEVIGLTNHGAEVGRAVRAIAVVLVALPLFARRWFPFAAPLGVWVLGAVYSFFDGVFVASSFSVYVAGVAAAYLFGNLGDPVRPRIGLAVILAGAAVVVSNDPRHTVADFVSIPATFTVAWLAGVALRARSEQAEHAEERASLAERERESSARMAVAEERARITRELHDIVAHAVSVMVLQVGAVRHRLPDSLSEDREGLRTVEEVGRGALTEMRRLLSETHHDDEADRSPQPGLDRLGALMEEVRLAGLEVRFRVEGQPVSLPRAIDLSAYRIIQEGLTNSLKHSGARAAEVTVRYTTRDVHLEVFDDGAGATIDDGLGRGLMGIRERVKIYGGEMTAGGSSKGGYLLKVSLPIVGSQP
jgi:signal transduction histidine kinase